LYILQKTLHFDFKIDMKFDPQKQTVKENYKLLIGSILPRPIAFVSTRSKSGQLNLAPFSFFTGISSMPPTICFASARKGEEGIKKDTLSNIEETGEFVVNVVTEDIASQMNETATEFPPDIDEFKLSGLTPAECDVVSVPRVKESPINLECKLYKVLHIGAQAAGGSALIIGEIILFHIADDLLQNGRINTELLRPVGRLAGQEYTKLGKIFTLERKPYKP
jgi:flavin reductase (DIM6/NTAB) family NADH-FMN oxidoreductase RutF